MKNFPARDWAGGKGTLKRQMANGRWQRDGKRVQPRFIGTSQTQSSESGKSGSDKSDGTGKSRTRTRTRTRRKGVGAGMRVQSPKSKVHRTGRVGRGGTGIEDREPGNIEPDWSGLRRLSIQH